MEEVLDHHFTFYYKNEINGTLVSGKVQLRSSFVAQTTLQAKLRYWGPFLESPDNFSGPKSNIQIEI